MSRIDNSFLRLDLDADANWTPSALWDTGSGRRIAGAMRVGYYLEDETYVDERRTGGAADVAPARMERRDQDGVSSVTVRSATRQFDICRRYSMRRDDPFLHCVYELTPRPGVRERGGRLDMPLIEFGDGIESPAGGDNDLFQFPVDLGGGLRRAAWRVARDAARTRGLGVLYRDAEGFFRGDVMAAGFAMRSGLFSLFWKDSDAMWRIGLSSPDWAEMRGVHRSEFFLFAHDASVPRNNEMEMFAGSTYGLGRRLWLGPVLPVASAPQRWFPSVPHDKPLDLALATGGAVRLLLLPREDAARLSATVAGEAANAVTVRVEPSVARGWAVEVRGRAGVPPGLSRGALCVGIGDETVEVPVSVTIMPAVTPRDDDGTVVTAREMARTVSAPTRFTSGGWWFREDVPSIGGAGALEIMGMEGRPPLEMPSPVRGFHEVVAGVGACPRVFAEIPKGAPLRMWSKAVEFGHGGTLPSMGDVSMQVAAQHSAPPVRVYGARAALRSNEILLGSADLSDKTIAIHPTGKFPDVLTLQYLRFVPCDAAAPAPKAGNFRLGGICDVFDVAHASGPSQDGESYRAAIRQHAEAGFDTVYWQSLAGVAFFPCQACRPAGPEPTSHNHYNPAARSVGVDIGAGVDPLAIAVEEARRLGIRLIGWVRPYFATGAVPGARPEWRVKRADGRWIDRLSIAHEPVRRLYRQAVAEVAAHGVDGILYDFMRHPPVMHYCDPLVEGFRRKYGEPPRTLTRAEGRNQLDEPWLKYRAETVTALLRDIRGDLDRAGRGHVRLTVRTQASFMLYDGCDFLSWVREGLVTQFLFQIRMPGASLGGWMAERPFDLAAYLAEWESELTGLPPAAREAAFGQDPRPALCLDLPESVTARPEDMIRIAEWASQQGFGGLAMHESNDVVLQPGKPAALRKCARGDRA